MKILHFSLAISLFMAVSCNKKNESNTVKEIYIDFDNIETLDLSEGKEIKLEFTDSSIIRSVDELRVNDNTHYLIRSRSDLFHFDANGNFKNQIGGKGNGPMEYTNFSSFFVKNNSVHIYDFMAKRILRYDWDGNYLNSVSLKDAYTDIVPNYIFALPNNRYISKNTFGGDHQQTTSYSILDQDFNITSNIADKYLENGITFSNNFFADEDAVLFWEIFNDTVFSVTNDTTYAPKYFINFNTKSIPSNIKSLDTYDIIDFTNKPENKSKYATLVRCVYEDAHYLRFIFAHNAEVYYVKSHKANNDTKTYKLSYPDKMVDPLIFFENNTLIVSVNSFEDAANPSLIVLDESVL